MTIIESAAAIQDYVIKIRRELHEYPELSLQEFETQKRIMRELDAMGVSYDKAGTTSVVARINPGKGTKVVALRADTDALPIIEESGVPYASKSYGVMHACGHDNHTAMLLGAVKLLNEMKDELPGEVRCIFQEAEELCVGAQNVIADGHLKDVNAIFGLHGMSNLETGFYDVNPGYKLAGADTIYVKFEGVSGHSSTPQLAKDTVYPACMFVNELQSIATKKVDPKETVIIAVGRISGGTKSNIIAKYSELDISMRYFNPDVRKAVHEAIQRLADATALAHEIKVEVIFEETALSTYNNEAVTVIAQDSAEKVYGPGRNVDLYKQMGSEDMSYYFQEVPGTFALLGYYNEAKGSVYFPHHEKFNVDEDMLKYGVALHAQFAVDYLNQ
ncbi:amidohydrolase [Acidaminobacter sp.]|uniref:amidohydrolase n=1 Tax=Acidaminobacter sp. TaxID=1872102 RepID=UPI00256B100D|nr:amidohydrolase [Acidaminobacter sp.]MDK9711185.1 amidohydrolase [Acidaminobacter sp.]